MFFFPRRALKAALFTKTICGLSDIGQVCLFSRLLGLSKSLESLERTLYRILETLDMDPFEKTPFPNTTLFESTTFQVPEQSNNVTAKATNS